MALTWCVACRSGCCERVMRPPEEENSEQRTSKPAAAALAGGDCCQCQPCTLEHIGHGAAAAAVEAEAAVCRGPAAHRPIRCLPSPHARCYPLRASC